MLYSEIIAVCSQIHTKHIQSVWAEGRICKHPSWRCTRLPLVPSLPSTTARHRAVPVHASSNPNSLSLQMHASKLGHKTACPEIWTFCQAFRTDCCNTTLKIVPWQALTSHFVMQFTVDTCCIDRLCSPQSPSHNKKSFSMKEKGHSFCAVLSSCGNTSQQPICGHSSIVSVAV